jgi:sugar phosphate permease
MTDLNADDPVASPATSEHDPEPGTKNETNNYYDPNFISNGANDTRAGYDELHVVCPPHTTEKKLMAKIDLRVIPFLCILYLLAFLDRVNIANARSFGLVADLKLKNVEYNTALTIFFVPYVVFEIPSNVIMKKLRPHVWLSGCMFMFGLVTVCQGLVQNYSGLLATRFFLGFFEVCQAVFGLPEIDQC